MKEEEKTENHYSSNFNQLPMLEIEMLQGHDTFLQRKLRICCKAYNEDTTLALFHEALKQLKTVTEHIKKK